MVLDACGLAITGASAGAVGAYDRFASAWTDYSPDVGAIFEAAEASPGSALIQAYAALVHMSLEAGSGYIAAMPFTQRAMEAAPAASAREQAIVAACRHWADANAPQALKSFLEAVDLAPSDIVAAKWGQYLAFNLGDAATMRRLSDRILPAHESSAAAWGMHAFALEQSHDLAGAEAAACRSLEINPDEAWAQHAMAHVFETRGQIEDGIGLLTAASPRWASRSVFMREHNYWHLALFHLDNDDPSSALGIFDRHLWGEWPEFAQEQIGAVAMLCRLELRGAEVASRWQPVIRKIRERGHEHIWPFHDLHYALALARDTDPASADAFLASLDEAAGQRGGVWESHAAPLARALVEHARGHYAQAADLLGPRIATLHLIGGSHAQRDLFVQLWLDAAIGDGRKSEVAAVLQSRAKSRPAVGVHRRDIMRLSAG